MPEGAAIDLQNRPEHDAEGWDALGAPRDQHKKKL
jgi:hypothetical protein